MSPVERISEEDTKGISLNTMLCPNIHNREIDKTSTNIKRRCVSDGLPSEKENAIPVESIYEFTFDPSEEEPPVKKQAVPRKKYNPKPKTIYVHNNYETNILKTLQSLKENLTKKAGLESSDNKENECLEIPQMPTEITVKAEIKSPTHHKINSKENINASPHFKESICKSSPIPLQKHPNSSPWRAELASIPTTDITSPYINGNSPIHASEKKQDHKTKNVNDVSCLSETKLKQTRLVDFMITTADKKSNKNNLDNQNLCHATVNKNAEKTLEESIKGDNSDSVPLFEDITLHHVMPSRRSYGKVTKNGKSHQGPCLNADISAELSSIEELSSINSGVKKTPKRIVQKIQLTKKEEAEVEAWADAFNSMCEDVDEFPLALE